MTTLLMIRTLFEYNYWAIGRILDRASLLDRREVGATTERPHGSLWATLFHTLGAEWLWIERCNGRSPTSFLKGEEEVDLEVLSQRWADQRTMTLSYLDPLKDDELSRVITYKTLGGAERANVLWHILVHVVTHTIQHRAEAAQILTEFGHSPGDLDFDEYVEARETEV